MADSGADTESPACEPPCPVAYGRMGLFCTCGNVVKRWEATVRMLRGETETDDWPVA